MAVLQHLNFIRQAAWFPCAAPSPQLIIEAGFNAVAPVLFSAIQFGCHDIVKMRAGISPWHTRGIRALIEGAIPGKQQDQVGKVWKFFVPVEKGLFFFFVADLTLEFIVQWESQLFKLGGCGQKPNDCTWTAEGANWVSPGLDVFGTVSFNNEHKVGNCHGVVSNGFVVQPGQFWTCSFSARPEPFFTHEPIGHVQTRLHMESPRTFNYPVRDAFPHWFGNPVTGDYGASGHNRFAQPMIFRFQMATDVSAHAVAGSGTVTVSDRPIANDGIIPLNCFGKPAPHIQN